MTSIDSPPNHSPDRRTIKRWECHCQEPPTLLATYDSEGAINIKARDRYWTVHGTVQAHCPLCGTEHTLDLKSIEQDEPR